MSFGTFRSVADSNFDTISPGSKHFVGSGFWPKCLSQFCVRRVSLTVPKHLDFCETFHKADVTSRALASHFVSWFYGLEPPQAPTPNVESGSPVKKLLFAGGVSWTLCFITNEKGAGSSKILNLFIHAPYS